MALACPMNRGCPLLAWLLRGFVGLALLAIGASTSKPLIIIVALLTALIAFGGCPMCWTLGLIQRAHEALIRGRNAW